MQDNKEKLLVTARYIASLVRALQYGTGVSPLPDGTDMKSVFVLAKKHSLAGALWYILEESGLVTDTELVKRFTRERDLEFAKNLTQTREFREITRAFTEANIPFLPMKGFIYKSLWRRPEYRVMSDLDIYVADEGLKSAGDVLLGMGYELTHDSQIHDSFEKPPYMNVELHRDLEVGSSESFADWQARPDNPMWYLMSDEDCLVFHIAHMYKHFTAGGSGMRSFFDLTLYLAKKSDTLDLAAAEEKLRSRGLYDFYNKCCALSAFWFSGGEYTEDIAELEYYTVTGGAYGNMENRVENSIKGKSRLSYYLSRAFLPYSKMIYIYKWLKWLPFLLPVAWVMRLVTALFDGRLGRELRAVDNAKGS